MPFRRAGLVILGILLLFLTFRSIDLFAETGRPTQMRASLGFDNYCVPDRWLPLVVDLDNPPTHSQLEIRRSANPNGPFAIETFDLQGASHLELPVFIDINARNVAISLIVDGASVVQRRFSPLNKIFSGHIILCEGLSAAEQRALANIHEPQEPVLVIDWNHHHWPSSLLSYDAITAIVRRSGSPAFNPAQSAALQVWSTLGGRLVTVADAVLDNAAQWRGLLNLPDFEHNFQLNASSIFASDSYQAIPAALDLSRLPVINQAFWWLAPMFLICLIRKWIFRLILPCFIVAWIWFFWTGLDPNNYWQKGANMHTQVVIAPETSAALVSSYIDFPSTSKYPTVGLHQSPWGVGVDSANQLAHTWVFPGAKSDGSWNLKSLLSPWRLRSAGTHGLQLAKITLPVTAADRNALARLDKLKQSASNIGRIRCYFAENQLHFTHLEDNGMWKVLEAPPEQFTSDLVWIDHLCKLQTGLIWDVGIIIWPDIGLRLDSQPMNEISWASPILGGRPK